MNINTFLNKNGYHPHLCDGKYQLNEKKLIALMGNEWKVGEIFDD